MIMMMMITIRTHRETKSTCGLNVFSIKDFKMQFILPNIMRLHFQQRQRDFESLQIFAFKYIYDQINYRQICILVH